jgi:hypothetical protein
MEHHKLVTLLVLCAGFIYCVINSLVMSYQLTRYFKINRFKQFFAQMCTYSFISACILLSFQLIYLRCACYVEAIALRCVGIDIDKCPVSLNLTYFFAQNALPVIIVFGAIKVVIQSILIEEKYFIAQRALWRMLILSNICACAIQYFIVCCFI